MRSRTLNPLPFLTRGNKTNVLPMLPTRSGGIGGPDLTLQGEAVAPVAPVPTIRPSTTSPAVEGERVVSGRTKAARRREFRKKAIKVLRVPLDVARVDVVFKVSGNVVQYVRASGLPDGNAGEISVRLDEGTDNDALPWAPGNGLVGFPFSALLISNVSIPGAVAYLFYTEADPDEESRIY